MEQDNYALQHELPHDLTSEKNILGCIMYHDELLVQVEDIIDSSLFYSNQHKALFRILKYIIRSKQIIDVGTILDVGRKFKDRINGAVIDDVLVQDVASFSDTRTFMQDVARVLDYGMRRKAWELLQKTSNKILTLADDSDTTITEVIRGLDVIRGSASADDGVIDAQTAIKMVYTQINDNLQGFNKSTIKTGYRFTDAKGGLRLSNVLVIGAWTSVGKTSLAMNMAVNVAVSGVPVAYYSMEMGAAELWARVIGCATDISAGKILNYPLRRDEIANIDDHVNAYTNIPLYIDDKATTSFSKMIRSVRRMRKKYGIKMFVVDYLQIFAQNSKSGGEESAIGSMARDVKNVCKELDLVGVLLSQLRRDKDERHPTIDMLRGSGQIEESADNVVLIDRPDAHPEWGVKTFAGGASSEGKAELKVCKGRNIGLGTYVVGFSPQKTQFYELDGYRIGMEIGYDDGSKPFTALPVNDTDKNNGIPSAVEEQLPF